MGLGNRVPLFPLFSYNFLGSFASPFKQSSEESSNVVSSQGYNYKYCMD